MNGIRMGDGLQLTIALDPTWIQMSPTVKRLTGYVKSKFDRNQSIVDLSNLSKRPELKGIHIDLNNPDFISILFRAIQMTARSASTVILDGNSIHTFRHMTQLHKTFPNLKQLSLRNNLIANATEFDYIKDCKITAIILSDNPIEEKGKNLLENDVLTHFSDITSLDNEPVHRISFGQTV